MQLTEIGKMTPMPRNLAKDEDLLVEALPHFSWLLDHWRKLANRLTNLSRDGKGQVAAVADAW
jgi:hypothetical protein